MRKTSLGLFLMFALAIAPFSTAQSAENNANLCDRKSSDPEVTKKFGKHVVAVVKTSESCSLDFRLDSDWQSGSGDITCKSVIQNSKNFVCDQGDGKTITVDSNFVNKFWNKTFSTSELANEVEFDLCSLVTDVEAAKGEKPKSKTKTVKLGFSKSVTIVGGSRVGCNPTSEGTGLPCNQLFVRDNKLVCTTERDREHTLRSDLGSAAKIDILQEYVSDSSVFSTVSRERLETMVSERSLVFKPNVNTDKYFDPLYVDKQEAAKSGGSNGKSSGSSSKGVK